MKPKLILHIGSPKSGTSYIQNNIINSFDSLKQHGIHYLQCLRWHDGAHHELAFSIRSLTYNGKKKDFQNCLQEIGNELSNLESHIEKVVISSEILFYHMENDVQKYTELFSYFRQVQIVAVLRDPVDYLTSLYKQMVRDPNDRLCISPNKFWMSRINMINYQGILDGFSEILTPSDSICILEYDDEICRTFFEKILHVPLKNESLMGQNFTMDGAALKLKALVNKEIANYENNKESVGRIIEFVNEKQLANIKLNIFTLDELYNIRKNFITFNIDLISNGTITSPKKTYGKFNFFEANQELYLEFKSKNQYLFSS